MKNFNFLLTLIFLLLTSCGGGFGPVENSIQTKNVDFTEKDIIGEWKLDKFSYKYLSVKENFDSIYITFKSDSTFEINNSKHLFDLNENSFLTEDQSDTGGIIDNEITKGNWKIEQLSNFKTLQLLIENKEYLTGLNINKKEDKFQFWYFFGDPDSGERLRFLKQ